MSFQTSDITDRFAEFPLAEQVKGVHDMFERGWFPRDLIQVVGANNVQRSFVLDLIAADRQSWHPQAAPIWSEHADYLGATTPWWHDDETYWQAFLARHRCDPVKALQAAAMTRYLTGSNVKIHQFAAPPSLPGTAQGLSDKHHRALQKVRGLLAKAESTSFPEEAEALTAKAQELITLHAIDVALLADSVDIPGGTRIYLEAPYTKPKFLLLAGIAEANACRSIFAPQTDTATLMGHQGDRALTEILFTSLLVQGTSEILAAGSQSRGGTSATRSWRNSFWYGYAGRISERLSEASSATRDEAAAADAALLPVLLSRSAAVDRAVDEAFPHLKSMNVSISNGAGLSAGRSFAERASISKSDLGAPRSKQLGS